MVNYVMYAVNLPGGGGVFVYAAFEKTFNI